MFKHHQDAMRQAAEQYETRFQQLEQQNIDLAQSNAELKNRLQYGASPEQAQAVGSKERNEYTNANYIRKQQTQQPNNTVKVDMDIENRRASRIDRLDDSFTDDQLSNIRFSDPTPARPADFNRVFTAFTNSNQQANNNHLNLLTYQLITNLLSNLSHKIF